MNLDTSIEIYFGHLRANNRLAACSSYKPYYKTFRLYMESTGRVELESVTEGDWYAFAEFLRERYASNSRAYCINAIRPFFRYWHRRGRTQVLPDTISVQKYQEMHRDILDDVEYEALLEVIGEDGVLNCRDSAMIRILGDTGMRISELLAIDIADLGTGQDCTVEVKTRKSSELGFVMWSRETNRVLLNWLGYRLCHPGQALFVSCSHASFGTRLTPRSLQRIFREYVKYVTPNRVTPHSLRHTRAQFLLKEGATAEEFNLLLRHKNWNSRFKYLRLSRDSFREMASKYLSKGGKVVKYDHDRN